MSETGILAALREISPVFRRINASPRIRERDLPFSAHRRFTFTHLFFYALPADAPFSISHLSANLIPQITRRRSLLFYFAAVRIFLAVCKQRKLNPLCLDLVSARRGGRASSGNRILDERGARVRRHRQPQLGDGRRGRLRRHLAPQTDQDGE